MHPSRERTHLTRRNDPELLTAAASLFPAPYPFISHVHLHFYSGHRVRHFSLFAPSAACKNQRRRSRVAVRVRPASEAQRSARASEREQSNNRVKDRAAAIYRTNDDSWKGKERKGKGKGAERRRKAAQLKCISNVKPNERFLSFALVWSVSLSRGNDFGSAAAARVRFRQF